MPKRMKEESMWKVLHVAFIVALVFTVTALARPMPGPKTYSTHQWVKGFKPAPQPSYLDRRK